MTVTPTIDTDRDRQDSEGRERSDVLETLRKHRGFLRHTVRDLDDEAAARCTTVSALCLGGLIKHVSLVEQRWAEFIRTGAGVGGGGPSAMETHAQSFRMLPGETLAGLLADYERVAAATDELVMGLASLDLSHPLPPAPWFEPGASWSARRVLLHIVAETAQHAGHADIIREALDGQRTMG